MGARKIKVKGDPEARSLRRDSGAPAQRAGVREQAFGGRQVGRVRSAAQSTWKTGSFLVGGAR